MSVVLQTSKGELIAVLLIDLAKYYTYAPFHDIQRDYTVEFGDPEWPLSKTGRHVWNLADPSSVKGLKVERNKLQGNNRGSVGFLTQKDATGLESYITSLITITTGDIDERRGTPQCVVFGQVVDGLDVLDTINTAIVDETNRPYQDIRIHHTYVLEDPFAEVPGLVIPPSTPKPTDLQLSTVRLDDLTGINIDEDQSPLTEEQIKLNQQRDAESKALTLELIGDLPSAEVKPMENVLFVCKLNPVTQDEDLETIFSRFGKIISCEIVRDKDTKESMQYAFIEFEEKRSCENAYFKMDGVLIDDRRIHVDFSQSVSKLADAWRNGTNEKRREVHGGLSKSVREDRRPSDRKSSGQDRYRDRGSDRYRSSSGRSRDNDRYRDHRSSSNRDHHRDHYDSSRHKHDSSHRSRSDREDRDRDTSDRDRSHRSSAHRGSHHSRHRDHSPSSRSRAY
ncbi:Peptidyl-prolyl cis-trans isomerase-like 4 [Cyberlindnera fabianii]|uniref:Peptidyl-prolyl cis-trans isomerase n=1 Tax=Cyberlindnera fabianii TaxID=36022 RepID=A0A1V2L702_CYBFA|nr:Peptidyl-prolyl cis-trans isomerase-like 4 [Cyberlindnera fabianii]